MGSAATAMANRGPQPLTGRQQGRWVYYRLRPEVLLALRDWLGGLAASCDRPAPECP